MAALAEMYVQGVSTRTVKAITEELCGHSFSASAISAINKSLDEDMEVSCDLRQFEGCRLAEHIVLTNDDMKAVNTEADPNHVTPTHSDATKLENGKMHTVLGKHSWNVIRLTK